MSMQTGSIDADGLARTSDGKLYVTLGSGGTVPAAEVDVDTIKLDATNKDVVLVRDAAGILADRNGTNAQAIRVYNTFTDASNYERLEVGAGAAGLGANQFAVGTMNAGTGTNRTLNLYTLGTGHIQLYTNNALRWQVGGSTGHIIAGTDNSFDIGASSANRPRSLYLGSAIKQVGGVTTSGLVGTPAITATGRSTAQAAAVASVSTYTVGAADGSFEVSANVLVTTATTHAFTVTCAYTDEGNTARTLTLTFGLVAGGLAVTSIANGNGAVPYHGVPVHIRCKAATTITIATTGTFTTVAYNVEGIIRQLA